MNRKLSIFSLVLVCVGITLAAQQSNKPTPPSKIDASKAGSTQQTVAPPASAAPVATPPANEAAVPNYKYEIRGRRDPFRSLDVTHSIQAASAPIVRPPGLRGQLVSEIKVMGIVKSKGGLLAIVQGYQNKTFFVHANEVLYDGKILEIRNDVVVFNQTLTDNLGKQVSKQVVKKLYPTRGEGTNEK
jgi:Tfp pilus assembly protein PilP